MYLSTLFNNLQYIPKFCYTLLFNKESDQYRTIDELKFAFLIKKIATIIFGHTPLFYAIVTKNAKIVELLINAGADVNEIDNIGNTPLFYAIVTKNAKIVELLINAKADVNKINNIDGNTPLLCAMAMKNLEIIELLINAKADINQAAMNVSPLTHAIATKNVEIVQLFINANANVNERNNIYGYTPLTYAIALEYAEIVELLIKTGADVNQDLMNYPPLTNAITTKNVKIVELLIKAGANVNEVKGTYTPLNYAIKLEHAKIVEALINAGANVNQDMINPPPFHAIESKNTKIVELLIHAEANVDAFLHLASPEIKSFIIHTKIAQKKISGEDLSSEEDMFSKGPLFDKNYLNDLIKEYSTPIKDKITTYSPLSAFEKSVMGNHKFFIEIKSGILNDYYNDNAEILNYAISKGKLTSDVMKIILKFIPLDEHVTLMPILVGLGFKEYLSDHKQISVAGEMRYLKAGELEITIGTSKLIQLYNSIKGQNPSFDQGEEVNVRALFDKVNPPIIEEQTFWQQLEIDPIKIYQAGSALKGLNTAVDLIRFSYVPNKFNALKLLDGFIHTYLHMYGSLNLINFIPAALIGSIDFHSAINLFIFKAIDMSLLMCAFKAGNSISYLYSVSFAATTILHGYNFATNTYSLYNELDQRSFKISSYVAYRDIAKMLTETPLQNLYDFSRQEEKYMEELQKIELEERKEISQKLLEDNEKCSAELLKNIYDPLIEMQFTMIYRGSLTESEVNRKLKQHFDFLAYHNKNDFSDDCWAYFQDKYSHDNSLLGIINDE